MNTLTKLALQPIPEPVFVVGSPRSGTSILTWCLGQHSNLFALEESGWMGDLAVDLGVRHAAGSRRGERSQLAALGIPREEFLAEFGNAIDSLLARGRVCAANTLAHDGKQRWVDGTPEYSLHICGLRKLFPAAKFVHIVRDVDACVASMLNFHRLNGERIVVDAADAYAYWKTTVDACLLAESALGSSSVHRVRYVDLVENPQRTLWRIAAFLGERGQAQCCEPLRTRINSSNVPAQFKIDVSRVDPALLRDARALSARLQSTQLDAGPSLARAVLGFERSFEERIAFVGTLDAEYASAQREVARLQSELDRANAWAMACDADVSQRDAHITRLQSEIDVANAWAMDADAAMRGREVRIAQLQSEHVENTRWALHLDRLLGRFGMLPLVQCVLFTLSYAADRIGLRNMHAFMHVAMFASSAGGAMAFLWMRRVQLFSAAREADGVAEFFRFLLQ